MFIVKKIKINNEIKTLGKMIDNKKIKTTESLQMRFSNEVKPCNRNRETNISSFRNKEKHKK